MRLLSRALLLSAFVAVAGAGCAQAGTIYSTDFDNTPVTYTPGTLEGQDGWQFFQNGGAPTTASQIVGANPIFSPTSQSDAIGGSFNGQYGSWHSDASPSQFVEVSADIKIDSGTPGEWQFAALGPSLAPFYAGINILPDGSIQEITDGFPNGGTFSLNTFHNVDMKMNFATQTYALSIDGVSLGDDIKFCGANAGCTSNPPGGSYNSVLFDTFGSNNETGVIDNLVVQTFSPGVPEPATWAMLLLGVGLAGGALRMNRRTATAAA